MGRHRTTSRADRSALRRRETTPSCDARDVDASGTFWCPECGMPAWVEWADAVASTSGPVVLAKVRCFARHWFLMPLDGVPL